MIDGKITFWDIKSYHKVKEVNVHYSWITCISYWEKQKSLVSSSQNGLIVIWQALMATEIVNVYQAIYATMVVDRAQLLVCGTANGLWAYDIDTRGARGHFLDRNNRIRLEGHKDMVRCLVQSEHRLFSAGFDKRLVVFDTSGTTEQAIIQCTVVRDAHAGIISCLVGAQNAENQFLLISGSFDRSIKLWSEEGQLVHALRCFNQPITSIAYVPVTNTFWVAAVETAIKVFEIQTCIEVTDICGTFANFDEAKYQSDLLKFCPEINIIVGSTHRNNLMIWRSNVRSSVVALWAGSGIQTLAVNPQEPDNFYSMGTDNRILIWIRKGQTHYGYFSEEINLQESMEASLLSTVNVQLRLHTVQSRNPVAFKALFPPTIFLPILPKHSELSPRGRIRSTSVNSPRTCSRSETRCSVSSGHSISLGHFHSVASEQPLVTVDHGRGRNFLRALYVDQLELLVAACEDGMVYVFGYDYQGTRQFLRNAADGSQRSSLINPKEQSLEDSKMDSEKLRDINQILNAPKLRKIMNQLRAHGVQPMKPIEGAEEIRASSSPNHQIHLERDSLRNDDDVLKSVSRQLFGLKCQLSLLGHQDSVTSLLVLPPHVNLHGSWTLLSSGWDRKICIWDLETGQLLDRYQDLKCTVQEMKEIAADGAILDMAYNEELQEFACASADWSIYVRRASVKGSQMDLLEKYVGHRGEVVCITFRPNPITQPQLGQTGEWISGSDDCTIRVWSAHCDGLCRLTLHTGGPVTCFVWEAARGVLIAGVDKDIKTYDLDSGNIYQHYTGHLDVIRSLIVLPEREEYISASADGQLRIWRAWTGNTDAVTSKQQANKSDENLPESMDSMNEALHRAEMAASKLSSNPAAAIGAAARAYSAVNRIHSTV